MHPTISEQLAGIRRILRDVVGPEVTSPYPTDVLRGLLGNLEVLERAWHRVLPFQRWDAAVTAALLADARPLVGPDLGARIAEQLAGPDVGPADPLDAEAMEAHVTALRGLLAEAVPALMTADDEGATMLGRVVEHLRERATRYPLSMTGAMPGRP